MGMSAFEIFRKVQLRVSERLAERRRRPDSPYSYSSHRSGESDDQKGAVPPVRHLFVVPDQSHVDVVVTVVPRFGLLQEFSAVV